MTQEQQPLWQESFEDALRSVVEAIGGPKVVGHALWPSLSVEDARVKLSHALSPSRAEKLASHEWIWIMARGRALGVHVAMHFLVDALQYARPEPIEPEDEVAQLQRGLSSAMDQMSAIAKQLERVTANVTGMRKVRR